MTSDPSSDPTIDDNPWQAAAQLIQPALIRLIDQIRKQLEQSDWQGSYETREIYPDGQGEADTEPQILYWLHLQRGDHQAKINLWELCYQICFQNYSPCLDWEGIRDFQVGEVEADNCLFDSEGEVDWHQLDCKAQQVVTQAFQSLPID